MKPRFPIYIPSKNRADSRMTMKALDAMGVDYTVIVEDQQFGDYSSVIPEGKLLVLDSKYQDIYDTCDPEGDARGDSVGAGAARNFAWDHALYHGHDWHWIVDDNIHSFQRLNKNKYFKVLDGVFFRVMEDFCLRYESVGMAGPNYFMFAPRKAKIPPFVMNTRIYSCNLIRNDIPFRWRGRMNEDTILSLDMLKAGWATVLFNAFLQYKMPTQQVKGGYTKEFYESEGTLRKTQILVRAHPDTAKMKWKFGRIHHYVDYRPFKNNPLVRKPDVEITEGIDEYGMRATR